MPGDGNQSGTRITPETNMHSLGGSSSTSKWAVRGSHSVRQPVSCEPCRKRKIRCSRTRPPCDTCKRRGLADNCTYLKNTSPSSSNSSLPEAAQISTAYSNERLLARITNLENLLQQTSHQFSLATGFQNVPEQILSPYSEPSPSKCLQDRGRRRSPFGLGTLTTSKAGYVKYEPRSSQWTSILAHTGILPTLPSLKDSDDPSEDSDCFPFLGSSSPSIEELLASLPPRQHCAQLKDLYFTVFSPLFHILHDPTFHAEYVNFTTNPYSVSLSWLAILFTILSLSVTAIDENDTVLQDLGRSQDACTNIRTLGTRYRAAAMKCLAKEGVFWGRHTIKSLQALIMLGYAMSHSQDDTWVLLGMTYNVATALGCHIDPENFELDCIEREERRRCWAGMMMLYTIQSTTLGTSNTARFLPNDVQMPADTDDINITHEGILDSLPGPTQMSYLLYKFRLYELTAKICTEIFSDVEPSHESIQNLDHEICMMQETCERKYLADSSLVPLPLYHVVHLKILDGYSHQLFLLLHRPFFAQSLAGLEIPNESQIRCIASAEALLDIHRDLCETPNLAPYKWYTNGLASFHAFHAAVVLAVSLLQPIYRPQYEKFKEILVDALHRFESRADRSPICSKSARILRFLMSIPSPNSLTQQITPVSDDSYADAFGDWENVERMKPFADRLLPHQWLSPSRMAWEDWDGLLNQIDGAHAH